MTPNDSLGKSLSVGTGLIPNSGGENPNFKKIKNFATKMLKKYQNDKNDRKFMLSFVGNEKCSQWDQIG